MKRILIVDDNRVVLEAISLFFSCQLPECSVLKAADGRQAIETMETMHVDLILTDLNMPVVSGYQLIEYVKKNLPAAPVLGMTSARTPDVEERLQRLGVPSCIEKPFDLDEVAHRISAALEQPAQPSAA
jgi:CheY-like chemotaxis protein